jgi:pantoate--beta-alanine ligase
LTATVVPTPAELQGLLAPRRAAGPVGLVPTMGALHAGHLSLGDRARADSATVVVSIFVNPLQFAPHEDFEAYPRDLDRDVALLGDRADLVFAPDPAAFTPSERATTVHVAGLTDVLEGASRAGHFDGVTTVVEKLFNAVRPDRAYFGEKDFQQLAVIRRMAADLGQPLAVVGCPIVRDDDGLALSSRNVYLSHEERAQALAIPRALHDVAAAYDGDADVARQRLTSTLEGAPGLRLDYAEVVDPETLAALEGVAGGPARALVAAHVGTTRLIDNIRLDPSRG